MVVEENSRDRHAVGSPGWGRVLTLGEIEFPQDCVAWHYVHVTQADGQVPGSSPNWRKVARGVFSSAYCQKVCL